MADEELISINVWLAGRSYRIRIRAHEEEAVRKAVKTADDNIAGMRVQYAGKDDQDFMAMCLLMYATHEATGSGSGKYDPTAQKEVSDMIKRIDDVMKS
jgi:cell division protein ZapA